MPIFESIDPTKFSSNSEEFSTLNDLNNIIRYINNYRSVLERQIIEKLDGAKDDAIDIKLQLKKELLFERHYREQCAATIATLSNNENQEKLLKACSLGSVVQLGAILQDFDGLARFLHLSIDGLIEISAILDEVIERIEAALEKSILNSACLALLENQKTKFEQARSDIAHNIAKFVLINKQSAALASDGEIISLANSRLSLSDLNSSLLGGSFIAVDKDAKCGHDFSVIPTHELPTQSLINFFISKVNNCFKDKKPPLRQFNNRPVLGLYECHNPGQFVQLFEGYAANQTIDFNEYCLGYVKKYGTEVDKDSLNIASEHAVHTDNKFQVFTLLEKLYSTSGNFMAYVSAPVKFSLLFSYENFCHYMRLISFELMFKTTVETSKPITTAASENSEIVYEKLNHKPSLIIELAFNAIQQHNQADLEQLLLIAEQLSACKAELTKEDHVGFTLLHWAAQFDNTGAWEQLQRAGLNIAAASTMGLTPAAYAKMIGSAVLLGNDWQLIDDVAPAALAVSVPSVEQSQRVPKAIQAAIGTNSEPDVVNFERPTKSNISNQTLVEENMSGHSKLNSADSLVKNSVIALAEFNNKAASNAKFNAISVLINEEAEALIYSYSVTGFSESAAFGHYPPYFLSSPASLVATSNIKKTKTITVADERKLIELLEAATAVVQTPSKDAIDNLITAANAQKPAIWQRLLAATAILIGLASLAVAIMLSGGTALPALALGCILLSPLMLAIGVYAQVRYAEQAALPKAALKLANMAEPAIMKQSPRPKLD